MALTEFLILRKPCSGCLEERMALIQQSVNSFTRSQHEASDLANGSPRPEEAAKRPSQRAHGVAPASVTVGLPQIPAGRVAGEEYVGLQKYRQHQRAAGRARDVPVALGAPYIVSGAYFAFVVDEAALEHKGLLDFDMLVQCQLAPGLPAE